MSRDFSIPEVFTAVASAVPGLECIAHRDRRLTYADVAERTNRFANALVDRGFAVGRERCSLAGHESGQDHLALYLLNGTEYVEAMLGAYKARVAPFNVNYRYVSAELHYVLSTGQPRGIVFHSRFAPQLAEVLPRLTSVRTLVQVADDSDIGLLPGAEWFEDVIAGARPGHPPVASSPDDLYIVFTGGTTGLPKAVLWRQADILVSGMNAINREAMAEFNTIEEAVAYATQHGSQWRTLTPAPFMHAAGHWAAFLAITTGGTCVIPDTVAHFDAADVCRTIERERVAYLVIVGEAHGRPVADEIATGRYDVSSLVLVASGGAVLSAATKRRLVELLPTALIIDGVGASETGAQGQHIEGKTGPEAVLPRFWPMAGMAVLSDDRTRLVEPGHDGLGFLGQAGRVMLGYLNDPEKTALNVAVVDGVRYVVSGDRARLLGTGEIELHGRDALTVNSGGEKIFVEEVERALLQHSAVYDAVVCGRPSERWGTEVAAVVQLVPGMRATAADVLQAAGRHIAAYKLPKAVVFRDAIERPVGGKPDYDWARQQVEGAPCVEEAAT